MALFVRPLVLDDAEEIARLLDSSDDARLSPRNTAAAVREWLTPRLANEDILVLALCDARSHVLVGAIAVEIDETVAAIGYWVAQRYRGRGIATEAVRFAAQFAKKCGATRAIAEVEPENLGSARVLQKAGFHASEYQEIDFTNPLSTTSNLYVREL